MRVVPHLQTPIWLRVVICHGVDPATEAFYVHCIHSMFGSCCSTLPSYKPSLLVDMFSILGDTERVSMSAFWIFAHYLVLISHLHKSLLSCQGLLGIISLNGLIDNIGFDTLYANNILCMIIRRLASKSNVTLRNKVYSTYLLDRVLHDISCDNNFPFLAHSMDSIQCLFLRHGAPLRFKHMDS